MLLDQKIKDKKYIARLISNIRDVDIMVDIYAEACLYFDQNKLYVGGNVLYGTLVNKDSNSVDTFRFVNNNDSINCIYTRYNGDETFFITQEKLDDERTKITRLRKTKRNTYNNHIETDVTEEEIIYNNVLDMKCYESIYSNVNTYDIHRDNDGNDLINYYENNSGEDQIEINKFWYFKNDEYGKDNHIGYCLRKNLIGNDTEINEEYTISNIYMKNNIFVDDPLFEMLTVDYEKLDEGLFKQFLEGETTSFKEIKEKNNLINHEPKIRMKNK